MLAVSPEMPKQYNNLKKPDSRMSIKNLRNETVKITVKTCQKSERNKRVWDKKNYCIYCISDGREKCDYAKIARHIEKAHSEEHDVMDISLLLPGEKDDKASKKLKQKKRRILFERIRKKGNFAHNSSVMREGKGEIIVEKSPSTTSQYTYKDFLLCEYCFAFYHHAELYKHVATCHFASSFGDKTHRRVKSLAAMLIYQSPAACDELRIILSKMTVDDVSLAIRKDEVLLRYGNNLVRRHWNNDNQTHHISNKLRELGRLFIEMKEICSSVLSFRDCIDCTKFDFVIEAVTNLCGWDEESGTIATPSIGLKLGHSLKKISKILKGEALMKNDALLKEQADNFFDLVGIRWNDEISRCSRTELEKRKWNKPQLLPFTEDLKELHQHIKKTADDALIALATNNTDTDSWRDLSSATLVRLLLFNRRRAGEPAKITVSDFMSKKVNGTNDMNEEVKASLSPFERKLCSTLKRIEIRGKKGRKVPLIFTQDVDNAIGVIINLRKAVGVSDKNPYVFAVPLGSVKYIRGPDAIRKHVRKCKIKCPQALTTTNLRKQVATLSQLLNLSENELELLANHLGHDIKIHREYYRLPESTLNLAKVGKLLMALESGVSQFTGKKLDEIKVDLGTYEFFI